jgi:hypothetical protein
MDPLQEIAWTTANAMADSRPLRDFLCINFLGETKRLASHVTRPTAGESVAMAMQCPRTASLFYDRVWWPPETFEHEPPSQVQVFGATPPEIWLSIIARVIARKPQLRDELLAAGAQTSFGEMLKASRPGAWLAAHLSTEWNVAITNIYPDVSSRDLEYQAGTSEALIVALQKIPVVNERCLENEQVLEFRRDASARRNYRRFVHFCDTGMIGKSAEYIADELSERLDKYDAALRKHGIETAVGTIEAILDKEFAIVAAGLGVLGHSFNNATSIVLPALAFGAKSICSIVRRQLTLYDIRAANADIAYVFELKAAARDGSFWRRGISRVRAMIRGGHRSSPA